MAGESVARRYARAIFELATEHGQSLDAWLADLQTIARVFEDPGVRATLRAPKLSFETKRSLVDPSLASLGPLQRNVVHMLIARNRIDAAGTIAREFRQIMLDHAGIAEATVTTAVPIDDAEAERIAEHLGRLIGKKVIVQRQVDPSIIGGMIARVGDRLINGSIAGRLEALRAQLV